jgi:hypothetical protein
MSKDTGVSVKVTVIYGTVIVIITDNKVIITSITRVTRHGIARLSDANHRFVLTTRCSTAGINGASIVVFAVNNIILTISSGFAAAINSTCVIIITVNRDMSDLSGIFITSIIGT